jgi:hypothetical protein
MLITLLVYLCILAIIWWVITQIPLPPPFRLVAIVILAIVAIVMLLNVVGGIGGGGLGLGFGNHRGLL